MGGLSSADGTYTILDGATIGKSYNEAGLTSIYVTTPFTNNAVVYVSPEFGGVKFHAMYSNDLYDDTNKWSKNTHTYGAGLTYGSERAKGSVMYEVIDSAVDFSPMNANSGDVKSKDTQIFTVGSQYRFDSFTLYGTYQYVTHARLLPDFDITLTDAAINSGMIKKGFNSHAFSVSGAFPVFGGTFKAVINYMNGKAKDGEVKSFLGASKFERLAGGITYEYPLSKRSTLYGFGAVSVGMKGAKYNFRLRQSCLQHMERRFLLASLLLTKRLGISNFSFSLVISIALMRNSGGTKVSFNWVRLFRFYMRSCNSFNLWARSGILNFLCYTSSLLRRSLNDKSETTSASGQ